MKICGSCKRSLPVTAFYKAKAQPDGLQSKCKECALAYGRQWRSANPERQKSLMQAWMKRNPGYHEKWYIENEERIREWGRVYYAQNKDRFYENRALRDKRVKTQTPNLSQVYLDEIKAIYKEARLISNETGVQHHVDHIFPLTAKNCCGLHVPWNLQIVTAKENLKKHNKIPEGVPPAKFILFSGA